MDGFFINRVEAKAQVAASMITVTPLDSLQGAFGLEGFLILYNQIKGAAGPIANGTSVGTDIKGN